MCERKNKVDDILKNLSKAEDTEKTSFDNQEYDKISADLKREQYRKAKLENDALEGENISDGQDREQRKLFAKEIFSFVSLYMYFIMFVLVLCGSPCAFHLSDTILITLLGTTTANILGVLVIVVTYLFTRKKN